MKPPATEGPTRKRFVRPLLVTLTILWGTVGLLAHSEGARDRLERFAKDAGPAVAAIDPWFVATRIIDDSSGCVERFGVLDCPGSGGLALMIWRFPGAILQTAREVSAAGWSAVGTGVIALLVGFSVGLTLVRRPGGISLHPAEILGLILCTLLVAGVFTWMVRAVCLGLLSAFGAIAALAGLYSGWVVGVDIVYNAVMTWFHVPHGAGRGIPHT